MEWQGPRDEIRFWGETKEWRNKAGIFMNERLGVEEDTSLL